jgi:hypothetical protein
MSDTPTPETDAFITSLDYYPTGHQWRNFTRKLERERDEARERERVAIMSWDEERQRALREGERVLEARRERDEARKAFVIATDQMVIAQSNLREANKERDKARNKMADALQEIDLRTLDFERMRQERDEAQQQLRIAVGLLSTQPQFADKHPEDVLAFVKEGAK